MKSNDQSRVLLRVFVFIAAIVVTRFAGASPIYFNGTGTWDQATPTTAYSAAGATWQFSFYLPDVIASNPATQITDFSYSLNGTQVATSLPGGIFFFPVSNGGGFDLYPTINNTSAVNVISVLFPYDVGSNLTISGGVFQAGIELNDGLAPGFGTGTVTIVATPEPPSIILFGTALFLGSSLLCERVSKVRSQESLREF